MRTHTQKGKEHVTQPNITYEEKYRNNFQLVDVIKETTLGSKQFLEIYCDLK